MMKIQRILFAFMLLVAHPAIADTAARAETLPGATGESLQQQIYRAAKEVGGSVVLEVGSGSYVFERKGT